MRLPAALERLLGRGPRRAPAAAEEVDEELRFHLDMRAEQLAARGLTPEAARAEAVRRFGDLEAARGQLHHGARRREARMLRRERVEALWQDVRYAARQLRRSPGFAGAAVLTLGVAIAANATMFGIVDRLLLKPPAYLRDAGSTHRVYLARFIPDEHQEFASNNITYKRYRELADGARGLAEAAAFFNNDMVVGAGDEARQLHVGLVSASFWRMFDARPALGRFFGDAEDRTPAGEPVAVLGYRHWRSRYGGRADVLGRRVRIGGTVYTIVGVAPKGFNGLSLRPLAAYVPITSAAHDMFGDMYFTGHHVSWMEMIARRPPGTSPEAAEAELTSRYRASVLATPRQPPLEQTRPHAILASVLFDRGPRPHQEAKVALWLAGVAVVVLLIACANVANLLLARARRRGREIAVRLALGIGRGRLAGQLLTESLLLGLLGGALGLALAYSAGGVLRSVLLPDVDWATGALDHRLLLATLAAALVGGVMAGLTPAVQASGADVSSALKAGGREGSAQRSRARALLLVLQVALSLVLLVGAGLFARSFRNVRGVDLGFDPERVLFVGAELSPAQAPEAQRRQLVERMLRRAQELPHVEHAAITASVPFWMTWSEDLFVPGVDSVGRLGQFSTNAVTPDYFATMGTRILRGRGITDADRAGGPLVAVVDQAMARALWPRGDPIGQCLKVGADTMPCSTVVGVSEDVRRGGFDEPAMEYYLAAAQTPRPGVGVLVRTRGEARRASEAVRRELQGLAPGTVYVAARPLQDLIDPELRPWRLGATLFAVFGGVAFLLAAVGLYGVIAFNVAQRTHELGVRVALGAQTRDILRLVVGDGVRVAAVGVALGAVAALGAARFVSPLLFRVSARDPATLAAVALALLAIAVAASGIPAWRASRVDPSTALRAD
ncbi:MAG TPA: ADOP family duplicated permease [Gemmatimonadaceae bacterium]|nr:ADOP family duplicated permease [Gemmatimonadaceae bacterium]